MIWLAFILGAIFGGFLTYHIADYRRTRLWWLAVSDAKRHWWEKWL